MINNNESKDERSAMILLVGGVKGGDGKSNTVQNLAIIRAKAGRDVLLVDGDSVDNQNTTDFSTIRQETTGNSTYTCIQLSGKSMRDEVLKLRDKYDDIFIDVGGHDSLTQRAALTVADTFLIPVYPSSFSVWTLEKVSDTIEEAQAINPNLKAYAFLNRADTSGTANEETAEAMKDYKNIVFLETQVCNRKAFRDSAGQGLGIVEFKPKNHKAIEEMEALYQAIFDT